MQGACALCGRFDVELGQCAGCDKFVCLDCWNFRWSRCDACAWDQHTPEREPDAAE